MNEKPITKNEKQATRGTAFTLVEMLIVIIVLAILMTMLFPVVTRVRSWSREKQAMMEIKNIEIAIKAYHAVYGIWPNQDQSVADGRYVTDNAPVIAALNNNPRRMVFLQFQQSSISTNTGSYLDPWLHPYVIVTDDSCDNKVAFNAGSGTNPSPVSAVLTNLNGIVTSNTLNFIGNFNVGVMSWGSLDSAVNINQDTYLNMDLCSWQMGAKTK